MDNITIILLVVAGTILGFLSGYFAALRWCQTHIESARLRGIREGRAWARQQNLNKRN